MASAVTMVLSGGVGLGAYQFGAYAAMDEDLRRRTTWLAGSSIGAVNAALIAGNPPERRIEALATFWKDAAAPVGPLPQPWWGGWRHGLNWLSVLQSRSLGRAGVFEPSPWPWFGGREIAVYRLAPLARQLERLVDFNRLNSGDIRVSVVATDLGTGEPAIFDTAAGDLIQPRHILASCGFIPEFEATEMDGRLLGDGGLVANAPVELVLANLTGDDDLICFVLDLFARDSGPPSFLEDSTGLRRDLILSAPTHRMLDALSREDALRRLLATAAQHIPANERSDAGLAPVVEAGRRGSTKVLHLSYRPAPGEAGPEKQFDFSRASLSDRREAGAEDMARALELLKREEARQGGFVLLRVRR